jgi:uncharacterized membrane protein SpoIIM required for sporulation
MSNYIKKHKPEWEELERLVARARTHVSSMNFDELERLDTLYRKATIHLAQVSTRTRDANLIRYLNDLTAAAHSIIYVAPKPQPAKLVWNFLTEGFARAIARTWKFHAASILLMVIGALVAYFAVKHDPAAAYALLPAQEERLPGSTREQLLSAMRHGRDTEGGNKFFFASFLFSHNLNVGFLTLALGVLAAIPSVFLIVYNGMILGAFTAVHHGAGIYAEYWAWILPHGVTELSAIALAGGGGLMLGRSIVCPGVLSRTESLYRAGLEAVRICFGIGLMLFCAGAIESFLRQSHLPLESRFAFAGATAVFWCLYFWRGFVKERESRFLDVDPLRNLPS